MTAKEMRKVPGEGMLSRSVIGWDPRAVKATLASWEKHFEDQHMTVSALVWDLLKLVELLRPVVAFLEELAPPEKVSPAPSPVSVPDSSAAPPMPAFRRVLFGYKPEDVNAALYEIRRRWESELTLLRQEAADAEAARADLFARLHRVQAELRASRWERVRADAVEQVAVQQVAVQQVAVQPVSVVNAVASVSIATAAPAPVSIPAPVAAAAAPVLRAVPSNLVPFPSLSSRGPAMRPPVALAWKPGAVEESGDDGMPVTKAARTTARLDVGRSLRAVAPAPEVSPIPRQQPVAPPDPHPVSSEADQVREGLSGRMELLFGRFLDGKVLGADLTLPGGESLAPKGTLITRDLVRRAEEAGVLPALIAHMTIPGFAAD